MRCKNCGWENDSNKVKCEKCNAPLTGSMIENHAGHTPSGASDAASLKGTIPERQIFDSKSTDDNPVECHKCKYPLGRGMQTCPMCGTPVRSDVDIKRDASVNSNGSRCNKCGAALPAGVSFCADCGTPLYRGTINPWTAPQSVTLCTLKPLAWEKEQIEYNVQSFSGENITLNRSNTDPNNQTITSKEQAELTFENGAWYICDKSVQKTTFVHAGRKTKLEKGDIIILGNRRFEFDY